MLTQIEIDGFKTFKDFKVELAPFQVIIGPNGSGKSNLFDALHLLSRLAEHDLYTAFQGLRGDMAESFTRYPDGRASDRIRFAVEVLLDSKGQNSLGGAVELEYRRLRYELELRYTPEENAPQLLKVTHEALKVIPPEADTWCKKYGINVRDEPLPAGIDSDHSLFSAFQDETGTLHLKAYSQFFNKQLTDEKINVVDAREDAYVWSSFYMLSTAIEGNVMTAMLSGLELASYHAVTLRNELRSLKFLHLNPQALRQPCSTSSPRSLTSDGGNLAAVLAHMQREDKYVMGDISRDMANLVPGILKIKVERIKPIDQYIIQAKTSDQRSFSSLVLSDGTLRLLALAALKNDPQFHGALCIEEPENGVDPLHVPNMVRLLRKMATDFNAPEQIDQPLRQVLITTHSPALIGLPEVIDSLIFALKVARVEPGQGALQVTRMVPVLPHNAQHDTDGERDIAVETYTIDQVRKYLSCDSVHETRDRLTEARSTLHER